MKKTFAAATLVVLLQFVFCPQSSRCCDADSFVYEEFGQRCLRLSDYIKQMQLSYMLNLPDQNKHKRQLLNEWTSFYLDHGSEPPPGMTSIATDSWKLTIREAGEQIGKLTYHRIAPEDADWAIIPFYLLGQPLKMAQGQETIASWAELFEQPASGSLASESAWIGENLRNMAILINLTQTGNNSEKARAIALANEIKTDWSFVINADSAAAATVLRFTSEEIRAKLKKEFERWRKLFFM